MFGIGPMELVLILMVGLLVLGPKRMPELARTLGRGLSEFRRASNDLRQSLALDEIQNDLREGIMGAGTTHKPAKKPEADDRPAQAGDELDPGEGPPSETGADAADPAAADKTPLGEAPHPGELPLDHDPHADNSADNDAHNNAHNNAADDANDDATEAAPTATNQAADNNLGTIPVGRPATGYRKAEQPTSPSPSPSTSTSTSTSASTPSSPPTDDESEDERG
jgi:Tat protein translocase TatB subunit